MHEDQLGRHRRSAKQIDYIMISAAMKVKNIWVEEHPWFKLDHRALVCECSTGAKLKRLQCDRRSKCICGWAPGAEWSDMAREQVTDWGDWHKVSEQLRGTAERYGRPKKVEIDLDLEALLNQRRAATLTNKRSKSSTGASGDGAVI